MKTVKFKKGETIEQVIKRSYAIRGIDGNENQEKIQRVKKKVLEANSKRKKSDVDIILPIIEGIPYLKALIDDKKKIHKILHKELNLLKNNKKLLQLSFIDPIRLGCEELGITLTPEIAEEIRSRLSKHISFDQERYNEIKFNGGELRSITKIEWVPKERKEILR